MEQYLFNSKVPITDEYDLIVFGGGSAGCIAAIQAGRIGIKTALVEKNGVLGGTAVVASVNFPGLFHAWGNQVIAGIGWEVIRETERRGGAVLPDFTVPYKNNQHPRHQISVNRFVYSSVLDDLCLDAKVVLRFHEMPVHIDSDEHWRYVLVAGKSGLSCLRAKKIIDATGDANVAGLMGYEREKSKSLQPGTLIYNLSGYSLEQVDQVQLHGIYKQSLAAGEIFETDHVPGGVPFWRELITAGGNNMHIPGIDGSTSQLRSEAELKARQSLSRIYRLLRKVPGCEQLQVNYFANECGIRETSRIVGEARVTCEAYTSGYVWPDAVCYSFYPIDVHSDSGNTIDIRPLAEGIVPTIPYGALVPQGSEHLLVSGRCISGDREANSAYRVQASCMATGQAAGAAAAIAVQNNSSVRQIDLDELRSVLAKHQAIVPLKR
ncbi:FAD-dependent oxidoreductase [Paenibacillus hodogayensis]|uniref:FAD-dependent oxidoreductase n=1 Tax=Paenibacillus hodogayensis TaxID=279208 RepID=A0ABV5VYA2_9BACL